MKKLLNDPKNFVPEMLDGLLKAHADQLSFAAGDVHCIVRADAPVQGKVALAQAAAQDTCPSSSVTWAKACWTAAPWAMSSSRLAPTKCWR